MVFKVVSPKTESSSSSFSQASMYLFLFRFRISSSLGFTFLSNILRYFLGWLIGVKVFKKYGGNSLLQVLIIEVIYVFVEDYPLFEVIFVVVFLLSNWFCDLLYIKLPLPVNDKRVCWAELSLIDSSIIIVLLSSGKRDLWVWLF